MSETIYEAIPACRHNTPVHSFFFEYNLVEDDSEETTIVNSYFIKSYSTKIEYLDKENLDLSVSITIIDSEKQEFKIIHALSYELSQGKTNPQELVK